MKRYITKLYSKLLRIELYRRIVKHDVFSYAAQCAYYLMLALFPFMILILMSLTAVGVDYINDIERLLQILPDEITQVVKDYLLYSKDLSNSVFSPLLITAILISSGAINSLVKAFNIANDIEEGRSYFIQKILSIVFLISIVVIFTLSLSISIVGLTFINDFLSTLNLMNINIKLLELILFGINFMIYLSIIGLIYYVLPYKKVRLKEILPGTIFAAPSLVLITSLFGFFVNNFTKYSIVYGSLTSIVMLLIWLYVCSLVLIIGEEINVIFYKKRKKY